jgi:hypothetical protein
MKVFKISLLLLLAASLSFGFDFSMGGKFGLNFGWFGGQDWVDFLEAIDDAGSPSPHIPRIRWGSGVFLTLGFVENFAIQPVTLKLTSRPHKIRMLLHLHTKSSMMRLISFAQGRNHH